MTKKCIACGAEHPADAATCSKCGEASWGLPYAEHGPQDSPVVKAERDANPTVPVTTFARRNRRGKHI